jgi:tripartite-type tricarboxylate transporter receptor subunit TctC
MIRGSLRTLAAAVVLAAATAAPGSAAAQDWPARPVKIIAPFAPGGSADTLGRLVAERLAARLNQSFVVENRPGAGGTIGSEVVAKAAPDGYTLVVSGIASHVIAPAMSPVPFDPLKSFTHIALFGGPPAVLVVNPALEARDLHGFIALSRAKPGGLAYGSPGRGTQGHLTAELFRRQSGASLTHVPYKGASLAMADLIGGHIPAVSSTLTTAAGQIKAGKARALALSSARRLPDFADVPTFAESGYPELVATVWFGLSGPAGLPPSIVARLNAEVRDILKLPEIRKRLQGDGIEPNDLDAAAYTAFVRDEIARWAPLARAVK